MVSFEGEVKHFSMMNTTSTELQADDNKTVLFEVNGLHQDDKYDIHIQTNSTNISQQYPLGKYNMYILFII